MDDKDSSSGKPTRRFPCPFRLSPLPHFATNNESADHYGQSYKQFFEKINDQGPEEIHLDEPSLDELKQHLVTLDKFVVEQKETLNERIQLLRGLLNNKFGINDVDSWLVEQQEKAKESKPITLTMYQISL